MRLLICEVERKQPLAQPDRQVVIRLAAGEAGTPAQGVREAVLQQPALAQRPLLVNLARQKVTAVEPDRGIEASGGGSRVEGFELQGFFAGGDEFVRVERQVGCVQEIAAGAVADQAGRTGGTRRLDEAAQRQDG